MSARNPKELDVLFEKALNAGDLDGLLALYEPNAAFTSQPGRVVQGTAAIREAIAGFLSLKPSMALETKVLAEAGGIALLTSRWRLTGTGPDGAAVELTGDERGSSATAGGRILAVRGRHAVRARVVGSK
jgi:ketosteroid isomerase-like protein